MTVENNLTVSCFLRQGSDASDARIMLCGLARVGTNMLQPLHTIELVAHL